MKLIWKRSHSLLAVGYCVCTVQYNMYTYCIIKKSSLRLFYASFLTLCFSMTGRPPPTSFFPTPSKMLCMAHFFLILIHVFPPPSL